MARSEAGHYLLVTNAVVGTNGFGNHKHNDQLSFEYHHSGAPLIVDPGSYVYTSDADARNRFRSTGYHNTAAIDGVEQNDLRPDFLFRLFEMANAETVSFEDGPEEVEYVGRHHGYERLPEPVSHERRFRFSKSTGGLLIVDRFTGRGAHTLRWHFHLAPGISAERSGATTVLLKGYGRQWPLVVPAGVDLTIDSAEYSPSYGVTLPCLAVNVSLHETLAGERLCAFSISP